MMRVVLPEAELEERLGTPHGVSTPSGGEVKLGDGCAYRLRLCTWACGCNAREEYPSWFAHQPCGDTSHRID